MQVCTNIQWNPVKAFANGKLSNMLNLWRSLNPKYQSVYETQFFINILWKLSNIDFNVSATCCDRVKGWVEYDLTIWLISFQRAALNLKHLVAVKHFVECWNGEDFERFLPLVGMEECNAWRPRPPLPLCCRCSQNFHTASANNQFWIDSEKPKICVKLTEQGTPKFLSENYFSFLQRESDMRFESGSLTSNVPGTSIASLASCESVALFESDEAGPMDHLHQQVE